MSQLLMNKSICFIAGGLSGGGQEKALTSLANSFADSGHRVSIICLFKTEVFFRVDERITVIWPNLNRAVTNKYLYAVKMVPYIRKNLKRQNASVVISFGDWFNSYTIIASKYLNLKVFITNRMGPNLYLGKLLEFFNKRFYKSANGMIVQTNRAKEIMQEKYNLKNIFVIPNAVTPINVENIHPENRIITVGRLSREKGHVVLLEAFSKLANKDWILDIVGDGLELSNLKEQSVELGLKDRVFFHGHVKDFQQLLSKASIFVLPSFYEGFPNALVEAMSVPLVCVSSNCIAGPAEIIDNGNNGFLFETGSSDSLAKILNDLIQNKVPLDAIRCNAYKIRNRYDFQQMSNNFLKIIVG